MIGTLARLGVRVPSVALALALVLVLGLASPVPADEAPKTAVPVPEEVEQETSNETAAAARLGLQVSEGEPIDISSDELEALRDADGGERVIFRGNVVVRQGTLSIRAARLEAIYPKGAGGRPERIEASQSVRIRQEGAEARCKRAVFEERAGRIVCTDDSGEATLERAGDVVRGERIEFDLRKGILRVRGRARVRILPRPKDPEAKSPGDSSE
ncbi:MAG: hypothetical protein JRG76_05985 [Deltaproteobacteria bacterium]|nr:hypothetical protein [Deltaproteobacteria bacterium]